MGGGGKTSTQATNSPYAPLLAQIGNQSWKMAKPALSTLSSQTAEALQTGGVNAQIPAVNASMAAARQAASTSQQSLKNRLAQAGLLNSSFGQELLGEQEASTGQQIAAIPSENTSNFLRMGIPAVEDMSHLGLSGAQAAAQADTVTKTTPSFWDFVMQGMQAAGQGASGSNFGAAAAAGGG